MKQLRIYEPITVRKQTVDKLLMVINRFVILIPYESINLLLVES
jgi:hypothetical protein